VTLRFPYLDEPFQGPPPTSLSKSAQRRWRPLVPITIHGPLGALLSIGRALIDSGADDCITSSSMLSSLAKKIAAISGEGGLNCSQTSIATFLFVGLAPKSGHRRTCGLTVFQARAVVISSERAFFKRSVAISLPGSNRDPLCRAFKPRAPAGCKRQCEADR
jgi:hypothetical protein